MLNSEGVDIKRFCTTEGMREHPLWPGSTLQTEFNFCGLSPESVLTTITKLRRLGATDGLESRERSFLDELVKAARWNGFNW